MELKDLNQLKHLPPAEFDAKLGVILKAQADKRRATMPKTEKKAPPAKKASGK